MRRRSLKNFVIIESGDKRKSNEKQKKKPEKETIRQKETLVVPYDLKFATAAGVFGLIDAAHTVKSANHQH